MCEGALGCRAYFFDAPTEKGAPPTKPFCSAHGGEDFLTGTYYRWTHTSDEDKQLMLTAFLLKYPDQLELAQGLGYWGDLVEPKE